MKDMSRAIRRHHAARLKKARRYYFGVDNSIDPRRLGMVLSTSTPCSCWLCGNARETLGPTIPERVQIIELTELA